MEKKLKELALGRIQKGLQDVCAISDYLADHPEVSGQEVVSSDQWVRYLEANGFTITKPFAGLENAFFGQYGDKKHLHKIALLAEYDALPVIGHACGHCASGAASVLAAVALKDLQEELNASIHIFGTPEEEETGAKCIMANEGCFDGYDMAMMVHMSNRNELCPVFLALNSYDYTFYGQPTHAAATPWEGKNALNGVLLFYHALDMLRQHVKPDVRIHGMIRNGGQAPNIVPKEASTEIYIRALDRNYLNEVIQMVDDCAKGASIATQTTYEKVMSSNPYDNLRRNETGLSILENVYHELGLPVHPGEGSGSSDIGNVSSICPTFHSTMQVVDADVTTHTVEFAQAMKTERTHKAIENAASVMALQVIKVLSDPSILAGMKKDAVS